MRPTAQPTSQTTTPFWQAFLPVLVLIVLVGYGLILRPLAFKQPAMPLPLVFIFAACFTVAQLLCLGHSWNDILESIVSKFQKAIPAFMILFCIGLVIASWIICGTIPMLVHWGLRIVQPEYLYVLAFVAPIVFSMLTGTSWGSVGTIGVVLIGIAMAFDANLGIVAGAIVGGAYFGDKMSPLSDTTNLAALAAEVDLYDHIRSMMWTTIPAALIAGGIYLSMGSIYPPAVGKGDLETLKPVLNSLNAIFQFNVLLLLPPLIVLVGSFRRMPTVPVLMSSVLVATALTLVLQKFTLMDVMNSLHQGFDTKMVTWVPDIPETISVLLNRGGLYALNEAITVAFLVFIFIGALDRIQALPTVVHVLTKSLASPAKTVLAALYATAMTNALTANQYATSFIIGDAFKTKFDEQQVPRRILSRSLEDTGTMLESIVPWHPSALYMVGTLGVPLGEFWYWQLLSLFNFAFAILWAITGIGCGYGKEKVSGDTKR